MASDIWLRTILIVRKETRCRHIGYSYRLTAKVLLYAPSHRQDNTYHNLCYTSRGALAGTRNSSMGPPHEGSIRRPIAPMSERSTSELRPAPRSGEATMTITGRRREAWAVIYNQPANSLSPRYPCNRLPGNRGSPGARSIKNRILIIVKRWLNISQMNYLNIQFCFKIKQGQGRHGVGSPLSYFSFQPVLHAWCNKGSGMCYPVCGRLHNIKEPLLLIDKSSLCGGSGFPFSLSEWSLTIWRHITVEKNVLSVSLNKTFLSLVWARRETICSCRILLCLTTIYSIATRLQPDTSLQFRWALCWTYIGKSYICTKHFDRSYPANCVNKTPSCPTHPDLDQDYLFEKKKKKEEKKRRWYMFYKYY